MEDVTRTDTCQKMGEKAVGEVSGTADWALVKLDFDERYKAKCAIRVIGDVTGSGDANVGADVQKYGARTHLTTGKIVAVSTVDNPLPNEFDYKIKGVGYPAFADQNPQPTNNFANPDNELDFMNGAIKDGFKASVMAAYHLNDGDAGTLFDTLRDHNPTMLPTLFSIGGDSGSAIMVGQSVAGILEAGEWIMKTSGEHVDAFGRVWYAFHKITYGYKISKALTAVNALLTTAGNGDQVEVCTEGGRPAKPAETTCHWSYLRARCEPRPYCYYKFTASINPLNWHLGYSCRLRPDL